jgi:hypothetical protein
MHGGDLHAVKPTIQPADLDLVQLWRTSVAKHRIALIFLIAGIFVSGSTAWRYRHMPHLGRFDDDAIYLVCAKSLAEGHGYRIESLPESPAETKFPPLFPALLAAVWRLKPHFPDNVTLAAPLVWAGVPTLCLLALPVFRRFGFSRNEAITLAALIAIHPVTTAFGSSVMSELLFTVLLFASLHLATRDSPDGRWALAAGALGGAAYLTRTAAIPLLITVPLCDLFRRRFARAGSYAAGMAPAVAGWMAWCALNRIQTNDPTLIFHTQYLGQFLRDLHWPALPGIVATNAAGLVSSAGRLLLFTVPESPVALYLCYVLGVFALSGTAQFLWKRRSAAPAIGLFAAAYVAMLLIWRCPPNERYLLPLLPILIAGAAEWTKGFVEELSRRFRFARAIPVAVAATVFVLHAHASMLAIPRIFDEDTKRLAAARDSYAWTISATSPGDRFYAYDDALLYLHTGRRASAPRILDKSSRLEDREAFVRFFYAIPDYAREHGLRYALLTAADFSRDLSPREAERVRRSILGSGQIIRTSPSATVLQFQLP